MKSSQAGRGALLTRKGHARARQIYITATVRELELYMHLHVRKSATSRRASTCVREQAHPKAREVEKHLNRK